MTQKFVLIHSPQGLEDAKRRLSPPKQTSSAPFSAGFELRSSGTTKPKAKSSAVAKAKRPSRTVAYVSIGIWSLGGWLGSLTEMIESLNRVQRSFVFYEVEAAVPSGLVSRPERMVAWLREAFGDKPDKAARQIIKEAKKSIDDNLIAEDFFGLADAVRTDFGLDYLIGITPSMVAGNDQEGPYWNHFSTFDRRTVLASSFDLHEYARISALPLDAFLISIIVSQLLVAMFWPKLSFHDDTGCLFDYNGDRISLIDKAGAPSIEASCLKKIPLQYREAAEALVELLRNYRRP